MSELEKHKFTYFTKAKINISFLKTQSLKWKCTSRRSPNTKNLRVTVLGCLVMIRIGAARNKININTSKYSLDTSATDLTFKKQNCSVKRGACPDKNGE